MSVVGSCCAEDEFCDPSMLQQENEWVSIRNPVSERTAAMGDWRIFPHLSNKESWKLRMGNRAQALDNFLQRHDVHIDDCQVCKRQGAGRPSNWAGHIAAQTHFKAIGTICCDGRSMDDIRNEWWETWRIPRGEIAFNYIDGQILMAKGAPPHLSSMPALPRLENGPQSIPSMPYAVMSRPAPAQTLAPTGLMPSSGPPRGGASSFFDMAPEMNKWYKYRGHVGIPTQRGGDYQTCTWLQSKGNWKRAMQEPVCLLQEILERFQIYPSCVFCPSAGDFPGHLPAEKHFKNLTTHLRAGESIVSVAKQDKFVVEWKVPGGAVRWYHITGMILILKGDPMYATDEWHELNQAPVPQPPVPQAPVPPAPALPAPPGPTATVAPHMAPGMPPMAEHVSMAGGQRQLTEGEFFWRNRCESSPEAVASTLTKWQVLPQEVGCSICNLKLADLDQFKNHLESYEHFQHLSRKAGYPNTSSANRALLKQTFNTAAGARMALDHFTLALQNEGLNQPPGGPGAGASPGGPGIMDMAG